MNVLSAPIKTSNKGRRVDTSYSPAAKVITWQGTTLRFVIDLFETSLSKIGKASITPFEISFLRINNHTQCEKDSKEMKKIRSSWESSVVKNYKYLRRITWLLLFDRYFNYNNTLRNSQKSSRKKVVIKDLILGVGINNEFYVCPVYNEYIKNNKKIKTKNCNRMWGLGTPEDLCYFLKNYNK
jgi:hypothetical protein